MLTQVFLCWVCGGHGHRFECQNFLLQHNSILIGASGSKFYLLIDDRGRGIWKCERLSDVTVCT